MAAAYSSSLNVYPEPASGNGSKGQAVCNPGGAGFVVATTANRSGGTVSLGGIALEDFTTGGQFRVCSSGYVPASVVGTLSGSGSYANVTSLGGLTRSTGITADTIGTYRSDGGVVVDLGLSVGGAFSGNATSIQGVSVSSAVSIRSHGLAFNGTSLADRMLGPGPDARDYGVIGDGSISDVAKFRTFMADVGKYGVGYASHFSVGCVIDEPWVIEDSTSGGNLRGWTLKGDCAFPFTQFGGPSTFVCAVQCPTGQKADVAGYGDAGSAMALTTGGSGDRCQLWYLGSWGGGDYSGLRVTTANKDWFVGRQMLSWGAANKVHCGIHMIVDVPADDYVIVRNIQAGAAASDTRDGAIGFCIYMSSISARAQMFVFDGVSFRGAVGRTGALVEVGEPEHAGGLTVTQWGFRNCAFYCDATNKIARFGLFIGDDIVPRVGHTNYATNGAGIPEVYAQTPQCDQGVVECCTFSGLDEIGIAHVSTSGQSKEILFRDIALAPGRQSTGSGIGYGTPRTVEATGIYSCQGAPGAKFEGNVIIGALDLGFLFGGENVARSIRGVFAESVIRLMVDTAQFTEPTSFFGGHLQCYSTILHPSREMIRVKGAGPLNFFGCQLIQADNDKQHIVMEGHTGHVSRCNFFGCALVGTTGWVGRRGSKTARLGGPYKITSGETMTVSIDGVPTVITHTAANFTAAGVSGVDLNRVESWQLGKLWDFYLTAAGARAWGEWDNAPPTIMRNADGTAATIDITAGAGGNLYADLDWPAVGAAFTGQLQTNMSVDSTGWVDCHGTTAGTEPFPFTVGWYGNSARAFTAGTAIGLPQGTIDYGVPTVRNVTRALGGGFFTSPASGGPAKTLTYEGGQTTLAGVVTSSGANDVTVADPRCTTKSLISVTAADATAVALGAFYIPAPGAGSFVMKFGGAPAGTEVFRYSITEAT